MTAATQRFHHRTTGSGCDCPIHRGRERDPFTAPLGYPFAGDVHVEPITQERAGKIYAAHHSYMTAVPEINLVHHGLYYQSALVGAITYRYPLLHKKAIRYDAAGEVLPEPTDINEALPESLQPTARRILREVTPEEVAERRVVTGDRVIEAARICLGVRMPNLASAALARSMDRFAREQAPSDAEDVDYLVTFVRADYDGACGGRGRTEASLVSRLKCRSYTHLTGLVSENRVTFGRYEPCFGFRRGSSGDSAS